MMGQTMESSPTTPDTPGTEPWCDEDSFDMEAACALLDEPDDQSTATRTTSRTVVRQLNWSPPSSMDRMTNGMTVRNGPLSKMDDDELNHFLTLRWTLRHNCTTSMVSNFLIQSLKRALGEDFNFFMASPDDISTRSGVRIFAGEPRQISNPHLHLQTGMVSLYPSNLSIQFLSLLFSGTAPQASLQQIPPARRNQGRGAALRCNLGTNLQFYLVLLLRYSRNYCNIVFSSQDFTMTRNQ